MADGIIGKSSMFKKDSDCRDVNRVHSGEVAAGPPDNTSGPIPSQRSMQAWVEGRSAKWLQEPVVLYASENRHVILSTTTSTRA
jgi:hypothetical protein